MSDLIVGEIIEGALLETCVDEGISRPRVRAIWHEIPIEWRVEFPRKMREQHAIGSRFRANLRICQKHQNDGSPKGQPYLRADTKTIVHVNDYVPQPSIKAVTRAQASDERVYDYHEFEDPWQLLERLRKEALSAETNPTKTSSTSIQYSRNERIKIYVRHRANGYCENCRKPAPFISRSGHPYLEIHHVHSLGDGGEDSIFNTVAICPNCHAEATVGVNADNINCLLLSRIKEMEI